MRPFSLLFSLSAALWIAAGTALAVPSPRLPDTLRPQPHQRDPYDWQARHEAVKKHNAAHRPEYVVIGDSITHHWGGEPGLGGHSWGKSSWEKLFGNHAVTNMGFGFDYIDNAYYRIADDELAGTSPRVIIVLLGTNNLGHRHDSPEACAANMKAFIALLRQKSPASKILLLGVLPRREQQLAEPIAETNRKYRTLADNKKIYFLDLARELAQPGTSKNAPLAHPVLFRDAVHLNAQGYEAVVLSLKKALKKIDPHYCLSIEKREAQLPPAKY